MQADRHPPPGHQSIVVALLIIALSATHPACTAAGQAVPADSTDALEQRVAELQAEVREVRQTVALLNGGAAVVPGHGLLSAPVGQPFLPSTGSTQRTIATRASIWPYHYAFQSAVTADNGVTVTHIMTDGPAGTGGAWCVVLGDAAGRLYFFTPHGNLMFQHDTGGPSNAVTVLTSTLVRSNTTQLAIGMQDGTIHLLSVGHENLRYPDGRGIVTVSTVFTSTAADRAAAAAAAQPAQADRQVKDLAAGLGTPKAAEGVAPTEVPIEEKVEDDANVAQQQKTWPIKYLMFSRSQQRKVLISVDAAGDITVMVLTHPSGRVLLRRKLNAAPLAVHMNTDFQVTVQTSHAAVVVLLHRGRSNMVRPCTGLSQTPAAAAADSGAPISSTQAADVDTSTAASSSSSSSTDDVSAEAGSCQLESDQSGNDLSDLSSSSSSSSSRQQQGFGTANGTAGDTAAAGAAAGSNVLLAAVFDSVRSHRVFGVTADGDLATLAVPAAQRNYCKVVHRLFLGLPPGPVRLITSRGRLILLHAAGVAAFDTSSSSGKLTGGHLVSHTWKDMWKLYGLDWQQQQRNTQQQQQQQQDGLIHNDVAASRHLDDVDQGSSSSSSSSSSHLHTAAIDGPTSVSAGTAAAGLLLLPLGSSAVATFSDQAGVQGFGGSSSTGSGSGLSTGSDNQIPVDWVKLLQPFIVVMMIGVAVWQFLRASRGSSLSRQRRLDPQGIYGGLNASFRSGFNGGGFEGLGPSDLGQIGMARDGDIFGSSGFSGLDRDFGEYSGPRSNRHSNRMTDGMLDMGYGGLNAATARRRARQVMHGKPDREQWGLTSNTRPGVSRGSGAHSQGLPARQNQGSTARQQQQQQQQGFSSGGVLRSPQGQQGSGLRVSPSGRRVTFEGLADDSGSEINEVDEINESSELQPAEQAPAEAVLTGPGLIADGGMSNDVDPALDPEPPVAAAAEASEGTQGPPEEDLGGTQQLQVEIAGPAASLPGDVYPENGPSTDQASWSEHAAEGSGM